MVSLKSAMASSYRFFLYQAQPRPPKATASWGRANCLGVVGDGPVKILLGKPDVAAAPVRAAIFGIETDRLGKVGDGLVEILLGEEALARLVYARCAPHRDGSPR